MTSHLSPEQLIDLAEGVRPEASAPHLAACEACRRELAGLRAMLSEAAGVTVPEPSPRYWDRLSARVRDAVEQEATRPRSWRERLLQPLVLVPSLGAALAVAIIAVMLPRHVLAPDIPASPLPLDVTVTAPRASLPPLRPLGSADDPQLRLVAAYGATLDWDEMRHEVGLDVPNGLSDAVVGALTVDEQRELQRLLAEEMAQPSTLEIRS